MVTPLDAKAVRQVLRYWLALVRQEEALADRPKARRQRGDFNVDLADPRPGRSYFKLDPEVARRLLFREGMTLYQELDPERRAFLSHCLRQTYKREAAVRFGRIDPRGPGIHLGWPSLHLRRSGELGCLLRFEGTVQWMADAETPWQTPKYAERKRRALPPAPAGLRLVCELPADDVAGVLPFTIDSELLGRALGVTDEELADFFAALNGLERPKGVDVVAALCGLLESAGDWRPPLEAPPEPADRAALFDRLVAAIKGRLAPDVAAVYPVALVTDDSRIQATWHLQRDLLSLLRHPPGEGAWGKGSPLWAYLSGAVVKSQRAFPRGLRSPRALTSGQQLTAERLIASTLTAAQGPPGTGKTDLILQLVADTLITRLRELVKGKGMGQTLLLVTSTNNRAVDNVLDPIGRDMPEDVLPLGLRTGNQAVTQSTTTETLAGCRAWLSRQDPTDADARLQDALTEFRQALAAVDEALAAHEAALTAQRRRAKVAKRLAALEAEAVVGTSEGVDRAINRLKPLRRQLGDLERLIGRRKPDGATRAGALWTRRVVERDLPTIIAEALAPLGLELETGLPPEVHADADPEDQLDAWEEAIDEAMVRAELVRDGLLTLKRAHVQTKKAETLRAELATLDATSAPDAPPPAMVGAHSSLFALACRVRERWAIRHASALDAVLAQAVKRLSGRGSLRPFFEGDVDGGVWLRRLFPAMGCTLLSLGNVFPPEPAMVERVIIDEAGQCHPAYAVSALMRAERALVIGDVNQLQPVVRLSITDEQRVRRVSEVTLSDAQLEPYRVHNGAPNSAQAVADRAVADRPVLRDHFRCQPAIIAVSDRLCDYGLTVHTPRRSLVDRVSWLHGPLLLSPIDGEQVRARGSWANPAEADQVLDLLRRLSLAGLPFGEIAVLTPYVGQLELLRQRLRDVGVPLEADRDAFASAPALFDVGTLATGTVHRFQGGERTLVIFSTVVSQARSLGFLNTRVNLINVAVSRARDHLIVVGSADTLAQGSYTRELVSQAEPLGDLRRR